MTSRDPLPEGSVLLDDYTLGQVLGRGSFSLIYEAWEGPRLLQVAIKEFFPEGCRRDGDRIVAGGDWTPAALAAHTEAFRKEAKQLRRFANPGVVRVLASFEANGTVYLVEELLEGFPLSAGLAVAGAMSEERVLEVARDVGLALIQVHAAGLVHCDVKPDNLFLTRDERCVLLDFGATVAAGERATGLSPGYAPPEQYTGVVTPRVDIYALAATMFHLLGDAVPTEARSRLAGQPLVNLSARNPLVSERTESALLGAMQLDPQVRPHNVEEFLGQLGVESLPRPLEPFIMSHSAQTNSPGCAALILCGGLLYSGTKDGSLRCWNWPWLELLTCSAAHTGGVTALAADPQGQFVVSGSASGEVKLWAPGLSGDPHVVQEHGPGVHSITCSPAGWLAVGCINGSIRLFTPGSRDRSWGAHRGLVNACAATPDGARLFTAGDDGKVQLWNVEDLSCVATMFAHERPVQSLSLSPQGDLLLTTSSDLTARLWELEPQRQIREFRGHKANVWSAFFDPVPRMVYTTCSDGGLRAFRSDNTRLALQVTAHEGWARGLAVDERERLLVTGGADSFLRVWHLP